MEIAVISVFFILALLGVILILLYVIGILFEFTILQSIFYFLYKICIGVYETIYDLLRMLFSRTNHSVKMPSSPVEKNTAPTNSYPPSDSETIDNTPRCQCGAALPYSGAYCSWCGRGEKKKDESS